LKRLAPLFLLVGITSTGETVVLEQVRGRLAADRRRDVLAELLESFEDIRVEQLRRDWRPRAKPSS